MESLLWVDEVREWIELLLWCDPPVVIIMENVHVWKSFWNQWTLKRLFCVAFFLSMWFIPLIAQLKDYTSVCRIESELTHKSRKTLYCSFNFSLCEVGQWVGNVVVVVFYLPVLKKFGIKKQANVQHTGFWKVQEDYWMARLLRI